MTLLSELDVEESAATERALEAYRAIVRRIAAGDDDPELSEVRAALSAAHKTSDDLKEDIRLEHNLQAQLQLIAAGEAAVEDKRRITDQLAAASEALERAKAAYNAKVGPLRMKLITADRDISIGLATKHELARSRRDMSPSARLRTVEIDQRSAQSRLAEALGTIKRIKAQMGDTGTTKKPADADLLKQLDKARNEKGRMERELESLSNEARSLARKINQGQARNGG